MSGADVSLFQVAELMPPEALAKMGGDKARAAAIALQAFSENPLGEWPRQWSELLAGEVEMPAPGHRH